MLHQPLVLIFRLLRCANLDEFHLDSTHGTLQAGGRRRTAENEKLKTASSEKRAASGKRQGLKQSSNQVIK